MSLSSRFNFLKQFLLNEKSEEEGGMKDSSSDKKNKQLVSKQKETNLAIPETLRSEFHFLKFPFFDLCPRASKKDRIEVKEVEETEEGKIEIWWKVSRNIDSDFPSSFARRLHKEVVEKILNITKKPVSRLICIGSMRQICRSMSISASGKSIKEIKKALQEIKAATIEAKGTFRLKEKNGAKKFFEGSFNLYDMIFFTGETLPDGTKADAVYVLLSDMYVQNFNNNFVVPLDYQYVQGLKGDIASRMYEILSVWFYPALENGRTYIQKKYSELCSYFPLTRQDSKKRAKSQLKRAHQQHVTNGFFASEPDWMDTDKKDDWLIRYYVGPKARDWYKQNKKVGHLDEEVKQLETPGRVKKLVREEKKAERPQEQQAKTEESPLVKQLVDVGVTKKIAKQLVGRYDAELIKDWIEASQDLKADDKAAFLVRAIQDDWALPESFRKKKKKRIREETEKREEELKDQYYKFLKEKVDPYIDQIDQAKKEEELKKQEEIFVTEHPFYKQFQGMSSLRPYVMGSYREAKRKEMGLPSLEEWAKQEGIPLPESLKEAL